MSPITRFRTLLIMLYIISISTSANGSQFDILEKTIGKICPDECPRLITQLNNKQYEDAFGLLKNIVYKCKSILDDTSINKDRRAEAAESLEKAWGMIFYVYESTKSELLRTSIIEYWEESLTDEPYTFIPIMGLYGKYARTFFTKKFLQLFDETQNSHTMRAICHRMISYPRQEDISRIHKRYIKEKNKAIKSSLGITSQWVSYQLHPRPGDPGPQAGLAPPDPRYIVMREDK